MLARRQLQQRHADRLSTHHSRRPLQVDAQVRRRLEPALAEKLVARVRKAILGNDAAGVPGLEMTPAQVEQLLSGHHTVEDMIAALEAKAPSIANEINNTKDTSTAATMAPLKRKVSSRKVVYE